MDIARGIVKRSPAITLPKLIEQKINTTEQALEKFAGAIAEYAQHLASHTSAIQGLSEASHELKRSAAEQNRVLIHLMENLGQPVNIQEIPATKTIEQPIAQEMETPTPEPEQQPTAITPRQHSIPGCARRQPVNDEEKLETLRQS